MANKSRHEYDIKIGGSTYKIRFSNRGHREAEDQMGTSGEYIQTMMNNGVMDQRLMTALLWGGTRKNHETDLPEIDDIDDLIDDMLDELEGDDGTKMINNFMAPLMAAYGRQDLETVKRGMRRRTQSGVVEADEESSNGSNGSPKGKKAVQAVEQQEEATG